MLTISILFEILMWRNSCILLSWVSTQIFCTNPWQHMKTILSLRCVIHCLILCVLVWSRCPMVTVASPATTCPLSTTCIPTTQAPTWLRAWAPQPACSLSTAMRTTTATATRPCQPVSDAPKSLKFANAQTQVCTQECHKAFRIKSEWG